MHEIHVGYREIREGIKVMAGTTQNSKAVKTPQSLYKPKLSTIQQIEHLKKKGITFSIYSEADALLYLNKNNNYFKLRAYRKNYAQNNNGEYIGLDFAYLRDIAIIDMRIRYCLLLMCLDIEHAARVRLIKVIEDRAQEDGYSVVADYAAMDPDFISRILTRTSGNAYTEDLAIHYTSNPMPVWALVELMQFAELCRFYKFVGTRVSDKKMLNEYYMFQEIRNLRNACAHSNCILNDLTATPNPKFKPTYEVVRELSAIKSISGNVRRAKMSNAKIRQITTLLYLHKSFVQSDGVNKHQAKELHEVFIRRPFEHIEYFKYAQALQTTFEFFKKVVDSWYPTSI